MRRNFAFLLGTVTGACLTVLVTGPQGTHLVAAAKAAARSDAYTQLNLFGNVFERIKTSYVEKPDDSKLMEGAINGMISALDPHSRYMNEKGWSDMQETTHGEFGGLGIEVTMEDGLVKVVTPIDDTPAAKAGILSGDVITQIDDDAVSGLTLEQAVNRMKGPANSKIRLKLLRKGSDTPVDVAIVREVIRVRPVRFHTEGGDIGYVRITSFNEQTTDGLRKAISEISKQRGGVHTYALDLADLQQVRDVVEQFFRQAAHPFGLICNAGDLGLLGPFLDCQFADWAKSLQQNFLGHIAMIHAFGRGFRVAGLEPSPSMREEALANNPGTEIIDGDIESMPFADASFDLAIAIEVVRYLEDPARAFGELARVLRPGGTAIVTATPLLSIGGYALVHAVTSRVTVPTFQKCKQSFMTTVSARRTARAAGFSSVDVHGAFFGPWHAVGRLSPRMLGWALRAVEPIDDLLSDRWPLRDFANHLVIVARR